MASSFPVVFCAVCKRRVDYAEAMPANDQRSVTYRVRCHGAEAESSLHWQDVGGATRITAIAFGEPLIAGSA